MYLPITERSKRQFYMHRSQTPPVRAYRYGATTGGVLRSPHPTRRDSMPAPVTKYCHRVPGGSVSSPPHNPSPAAQRVMARPITGGGQAGSSVGTENALSVSRASTRHRRLFGERKAGCSVRVPLPGARTVGSCGQDWSKATMTARLVPDACLTRPGSTGCTHARETGKVRAGPGPGGDGVKQRRKSRCTRRRMICQHKRVPMSS